MGINEPLDGGHARTPEPLQGHPGNRGCQRPGQTAPLNPLKQGWEGDEGDGEPERDDHRQSQSDGWRHSITERDGFGHPVTGPDHGHQTKAKPKKKAAPKSGLQAQNSQEWNQRDERQRAPGIRR